VRFDNRRTFELARTVPGAASGVMLWAERLSVPDLELAVRLTLSLAPDDLLGQTALSITLRATDGPTRLRVRLENAAGRAYEQVIATNGATPLTVPDGFLRPGALTLTVRTERGEGATIDRLTLTSQGQRAR
jgi:hypothetical protein